MTGRSDGPDRSVVFSTLVERWIAIGDRRREADLAAAMGVHPTTLSRWKAGDRWVPDHPMAWLAGEVGVELRLHPATGWAIIDKEGSP